MSIITSELLKSWGLPGLIPDELLPMGLMGLFEAPISPSAKVGLLLREEILGWRGMVFVAARAARRACTGTSWNHPATLRALDLCDRYAEGEEVSKEELERAAKDAWEVLSEDAPSMPAWRAAHRAAGVAWAAEAASSLPPVRTDAWTAVEAVVRATSSEEGEERSQLDDCRVCFIKGNPQERAPVPTRYQRIMRSLS